MGMLIVIVAGLSGAITAAQGRGPRALRIYAFTAHLDTQHPDWIQLPPGTSRTSHCENLAVFEVLFHLQILDEGLLCRNALCNPLVTVVTVSNAHCCDNNQIPRTCWLFLLQVLFLKRCILEADMPLLHLHPLKSSGVRLASCMVDFSIKMFAKSFNTCPSCGRARPPFLSGTPLEEWVWTLL